VPGIADKFAQFCVKQAALAGHDGFRAKIAPEPAKKSLHFLVILRLWG
jgi:hypothetical protein